MVTARSRAPTRPQEAGGSSGAPRDREYALPDAGRRSRDERPEEFTIPIRRIALIAAIGAALIGAAVPPASAAPAQSDFYVDCAAKSAGNGTAAKPWRSLGTVNAHGVFAPGDRILLKRGTVCKGTLVPKGSGQPGKSIVLGDYGSAKKAKPTVAGGGTGMETATLTLRNQSYWSVQDLHITNRGKGRSTTVHRAGVLLKNDKGGYLNSITVQRLTVDNVTSKLFYSKHHDARDWGGIVVHTVDRGAGDGFNDLKILNNTVTGVGRTGITTSNREYPDGADSNVRIAGNTVSATKGDGVILRGAVNARVDHNTVKHASNMWPCPQCLKVKGMGANAGIWATWSRDSTIDHNNVYGTNVGHGDGEGIDLDILAERVMVQYNWIHDNNGGGVLFCGSKSSTARFNIFEDNRKSAIAFIGSVPARDSQIYNNTIYNSRSSGARPVRYFNGAHGKGITFTNNIVYNYGAASWMWPTRPETAANTLVGQHGSGRPSDSRTSRHDPGLKHPGAGGTGFSTLKGYRPRHPSNFLRGVTIPKDATHDFFGKKIDPAKPPRGAAG